MLEYCTDWVEEWCIWWWGGGIYFTYSVSAVLFPSLCYAWKLKNMCMNQQVSKLVFYAQSTSVVRSGWAWFNKTIHFCLRYLILTISKCGRTHTHTPNKQKMNDTNTPKIITFWCSFHPYISTGNADRITFLQAKYTQFCNNSRPVCCKWDSMYMEYPLSGSGYCSKILVNVTGIGLDELTETALRQLSFPTQGTHVQRGFLIHFVFSKTVSSQNSSWKQFQPNFVHSWTTLVYWAPRPLELQSSKTSVVTSKRCMFTRISDLFLTSQIRSRS